MSHEKNRPHDWVMFMVRAMSRVFVVWLMLSSVVSAESKQFPPAEAHRVLFLGDSITFAGHYVALIDARLRVEHPGRQLELLNLGLPSETCTGLSEPDHPFPRPDVHERLARALARVKPDVVVICYGMNDGIYYPFDKQRFAAYQDGIGKLMSAVKATGAKLVLMTPPPFDPLPLRKKKKLRPAGAEKYAWFAIYENYDDVLDRYAQWIRQQADRVDVLVDLRTPVLQYVARRRRDDPEFSMSPDGVHLNREGHRVLADAILKAWGYSKPRSQDQALLELVEQREVLLRDAWLTHVGHKRPGVKAGLPLPQAQSQAAKLNSKIDALVR